MACANARYAIANPIYPFSPSFAPASAGSESFKFVITDPVTTGSRTCTPEAVLATSRTANIRENANRLVDYEREPRGPASSPKKSARGLRDIAMPNAGTEKRGDAGK